jgi:hypothetical protein
MYWSFLSLEFLPPFSVTGVTAAAGARRHLRDFLTPQNLHMKHFFFSLALSASKAESSWGSATSSASLFAAASAFLASFFPFRPEKLPQICFPRSVFFHV